MTSNEDFFPTASYNLPQKEYDDLPLIIKAQITRKQYMWMDDESKRTLLEDITTPEATED